MENVVGVVLLIISSFFWGLSGFFLGRIWEMKHGMWRKAFDDAMAGWGQAIELLKDQLPPEKEKDGSMLSPFQIKK